MHFSANQIVHNIHKSLGFGLQTNHLIDFSKIYPLKGMETKIRVWLKLLADLVKFIILNPFEV